MMKNQLSIFTGLMLFGLFLGPVSTSAFAEEESAVGSIMNLLKSGRVPEERLPPIVSMVCRRGNAGDLRYVYDQVIADKGYTGKLREESLAGLIEAFRTRKTKPSGDLASIAKLMSVPGKENKTTRLHAVTLVGLWKVPGSSAALEKLALAKNSSPELREASLNGLVKLDTAAAGKTLEKLVAKTQPLNLRMQAVSVMTTLDVTAAAKQAAIVLKDATEHDDITPLILAFVDFRNGPDLLAQAIAANPPSQPVALIALRYMYAIGRTDKLLVDTLSKAAGFTDEEKVLTKAEVKELAAEVLKKGDPLRGEAIFRKAEVSCMKCHAISKAGGQVGPDLSPVGASSPVDYLLSSILYPNQAVKEAYLTKILLTIDGRTHQGIIVDRDDERVILKDATGKTKTIPVDDIDDEVEGISLMPKGLTKFLTKQELLDLVRFLSELGKPTGPFPIRSRETLHRWRFLKQPSPELLTSIPETAVFETQILESPGDSWEAAYSRVSGALPLEELSKLTRQQVLYLQGEIEVTAPGKVGVLLNNTSGITLWIDDEPIEPKKEFTVDLEEGTHKLTLRIDTTKSAPEVTAEFKRVEDSTAEFSAVGGP